MFGCRLSFYYCVSVCAKNTRKGTGGYMYTQRYRLTDSGVFRGSMLIINKVSRGGGANSVHSSREKKINKLRFALLIVSRLFLRCARCIFFFNPPPPPVLNSEYDPADRIYIKLSSNYVVVKGNAQLNSFQRT